MTVKEKTMRSHVTTTGSRLPIRERTVLCGDGETATTRSVYCARQAEGVALWECEGCERYRGKTADGAFAVCNAGDGATPPTLWARVMRRFFSTVAAQTRVRDVMTRSVVCVTPTLPIEEVTELFLERGISGAPVVDNQGRTVGIISKTDLVRLQRDEGDVGVVEDRPLHQPLHSGVQATIGEGFHEAPLTRGFVMDVMMPVAFTLNETAPLSRAAALMSYEGVHRLPVVDSENRVVGILSASDVVRWIGASDR
jgi:CBS domain-containing protein